MTREPIIIFESENSTGIDKIPVGTVIFVNNVDTITGMAPQYFVLKDKTDLTATSTLHDLFLLTDQYQRIGHQPHAYYPADENLQLRMVVEEFITTWDIPINGYILDFPTTSSASYDCEVDWGDGTADTITTWDDPKWKHTYTISMVKGINVVISGEFGGFSLEDNPTSKDELLRVRNLGKTQWTYLKGGFKDAINMTNFSVGTSDTSQITDWENTFSGCSLLSGVFPALDVSLGTNFKNMFLDCSEIEGFGRFSTTLGTEFDGMFKGCINAYCLGSIDTTIATSTSEMFVDTEFHNPSISEQTVILAGYDYNNSQVCPSLPHFCIEIEHATNYGYIYNLIGDVDSEISSTGEFLYGLYWTNNEVILKFGTNGDSQQLTNAGPILSIQVKVNALALNFNLIWDAVNNYYQRTDIVLATSLIDAYNNGLRKMCVELREPPNVLINLQLPITTGSLNV